MPIYEYECDGCHSVFEVRQKVSDPAPTEHSCGSTQVRRILSATSFVLKGTGWYATDYGNRKNDADGGKGKGKEPASQDGSAKQDAKAATTAGDAAAQAKPQGAKEASIGAKADKGAPKPQST